MAKGLSVIIADGAISSVAIVIYGIHILSGVGGAGVVLLKNGTATSDTVAIEETGTQATGKTITYPDGITFSSGCFVDIDANVTSAAIWYEKV